MAVLSKQIAGQSQKPTMTGYPYAQHQSGLLRARTAITLRQVAGSGYQLTSTHVAPIFACFCDSAGSLGSKGDRRDQVRSCCPNSAPNPLSAPITAIPLPSLSAGCGQIGTLSLLAWPSVFRIPSQLFGVRGASITLCGASSNGTQVPPPGST